MASILMVAPQPFFRARGTPFSVLHRIRALLADGRNTVHLLTYPFGSEVTMPGLTITRCKRPALVRDVTIGPSVAKIFLDVNLYRLTSATLKRGRYDLIHSHEEAAFFCQRFAEQYDLPHVYDMHSSLPQQLKTFSRFDLWPLRQIFERFERRVLTGCDGVITICQELADIAEPHLGSKPHAMIENTADDSMVFGRGQARAAERPPDLSSLHGKRIVLYTGTLEAYQGLELLLGAIRVASRTIEDVHLLLAGGSPTQVSELRARIEAMGLLSLVTLVGTVHPSVIPALYEAAEVIVSPRSRGTNTPLKIYSYLRSGKPIVATNLVTHTQTLTSATACLVEPSAEGLAGGIVQVLQDGEYASRLTQAALGEASGKYSDASYVARVLEFFDRVGICADANEMAV